MEARKDALARDGVLAVDDYRDSVLELVHDGDAVGDVGEGCAGASGGPM